MFTPMNNSINCMNRSKTYVFAHCVMMWHHVSHRKLKGESKHISTCELKCMREGDVCALRNVIFIINLLLCAVLNAAERSNNNNSNRVKCVVWYFSGELSHPSTHGLLVQLLLFYHYSSLLSRSSSNLPLVSITTKLYRINFYFNNFWPAIIK